MACTSTSGSSRGGASPTCAGPRYAFAREVERRAPDDVTTTWWRKDRDPAMLFVDYNQNARDHTIASAYSVRGVPEATVSTPITWDEIDDVDPREFTIATVPARFARLGDLHRGIDDSAYSLDTAAGMGRPRRAGVAAPPAVAGAQTAASPGSSRSATSTSASSGRSCVRGSRAPAARSYAGPQRPRRRPAAAHAQRADRGDQLAAQHDPVRGHRIGRGARRLGGEVGLLLQPARQHGPAERGRRGQPADVGERRVRHVLQRHDPRAGGLAVGQERQQPGERGSTSVPSRAADSAAVWNSAARAASSASPR